MARTDASAISPSTDAVRLACAGDIEAAQAVWILDFEIGRADDGAAIRLRWLRKFLLERIEPPPAG